MKLFNRTFYLGKISTPLFPYQNKIAGMQKKR